MDNEPLFDRKYVYPCDREGGAYVELNGEIVEVGDDLSDCYPITVRTAKGTFRGYMANVGSFRATVGLFARIRIYDAGGGWYPDNRITSIWDKDFPLHP